MLVEATINWPAVGVFWAVLMTVLQLATTAVLFVLRKQAQGFQQQAATDEAIRNVEARLQQRINVSDDAIRKEISNQVGEIQKELRRLETGDHHLERRVVVVEQSLAHAPKAADLQQLRNEISFLSSNVARFEGTQAENNRTVRLMHEFLMDKNLEKTR